MQASKHYDKNEMRPFGAGSMFTIQRSALDFRKL
jgi:hypothetical protein